MVKTRAISYQEGETLLEGFLAYPDEKKRPLVLLCHAWRGRDDFICEKAERIAALGYHGFALDMYGKGALGGSKEENAALKKPFVNDRSFLQRRVLKGFETARALPFADVSRLAVLGFGFGGLCALDLARTDAPLKGVISLYGHFEPPPHCLTIRAKTLLLHGYADPISSPLAMQKFQEELTQSQTDWRACVYGNAMHAFATPSANDPQAGICYDATAAKRAWKETENFLREILS